VTSRLLGQTDMAVFTAPDGVVSESIPRHADESTEPVPAGRTV
jgi:hypothetical protein